MIPKPIEEISEADITDLINAGVSERKTLEYKRQLPEFNDAGKRELLSDVSSFANTSGGDLIIGITESGGVPVAVPGIEIGDPDQEILRIDAIIRSGLAPRIRHSTRVVPLVSRHYVLIIRAEHSWYGPHRVIFKGDSRFWGRNSNGKYELDVADLRAAFLFAETVTEKIGAFRSERVIALEDGKELVPLASGPKLVLHCMPMESFGARRQYNVHDLESQEQWIQPMYLSRTAGWRSQINYEGIICVGLGDPTIAYTQVYRNAVIEAVRVGILSSPGNPGVIPSFTYEKALLDYLPQCFKILRQLRCGTPILIGISLIGVRGLTMGVDLRVQLSTGPGVPIDRDVLMLPEIDVEDFSVRPDKLLKPTLDLVWNACGFSSSLYFDDAGNWIGRAS